MLDKFIKEHIGKKKNDNGYGAYSWRMCFASTTL